MLCDDQRPATWPIQSEYKLCGKRLEELVAYEGSFELELQPSWSSGHPRQAWADERLGMDMCARSSSRTDCCPTRSSWCASMAEASPSTHSKTFRPSMVALNSHHFGTSGVKLGAAAATLLASVRPHDRTKDHAQSRVSRSDVCNLLVTDREPKTD